ncbi:hypothetical protein NRIC_04060 [Enterococcus florum]|uniref:Uncharacterized protein n=1 Tax=Enterococcus florum TaxID=2480627 RepID=A0A4P5P411_9ENTE|nr:hypothetical protein [Enterococcus florum]GCF92515.1 hypothetical protein NRIC_04060 [Enterococcus florum]
MGKPYICGSDAQRPTVPAECDHDYIFVPITKLNDVKKPDRNHAYVLPNNEAYILSNDGTRLVPLVKSTGGNEQIQVDWKQLNENQVDFINNKPFQEVGYGLTVTASKDLAFDPAVFIQSTHVRVILSPHANDLTISLYTPFSDFAGQHVYARVVSTEVLVITEWTVVSGARIQKSIPLDSLNLTKGLSVAFFMKIDGVEKCLGYYNSSSVLKDWMEDNNVLGIRNRPFKTIGDGLEVINNELKTTEDYRRINLRVIDMPHKDYVEFAVIGLDEKFKNDLYLFINSKTEYKQDFTDFNIYKDNPSSNKFYFNLPRSEIKNGYEYSVALRRKSDDLGIDFYSAVNCVSDWSSKSSHQILNKPFEGIGQGIMLDPNKDLTIDFNLFNDLVTIDELFKLMAGEKIRRRFRFDFRDKVSASLSENPLLYERTDGKELRPPIIRKTENAQLNYDRIKSLDNTLDTMSLLAENDMRQISFSVPVAHALEKFYPSVHKALSGNILKKIKAKTTKIESNIHGYGEGAAGNLFGYGLWTGDQFEVIEHAENRVAKLSFKKEDRSSFDQILGEDATLHFIGYAGASDGVARSRTLVDYVDFYIELEFKLDDFLPNSRYLKHNFFKSSPTRTLLDRNNKKMVCSVYTDDPQYAAENCELHVTSGSTFIESDWTIKNDRIEVEVPFEKMDLTRGIYTVFREKKSQYAFGYYNTTNYSTDWLADDRVFGVYNRPFKTIGEGLLVKDGELIASSKKISVSAYSEVISPDMSSKYSVVLRGSDDFVPVGRIGLYKTTIPTEKLFKPYRVNFPNTEFNYYLASSSNMIPQGFINIIETDGSTTQAIGQFKIMNTDEKELSFELFGVYRITQNIGSSRNILSDTYNADSYGEPSKIIIEGGQHLFFVDGMKKL